jgi:hypothetical protein
MHSAIGTNAFGHHRPTPDRGLSMACPQLCTLSRFADNFGLSVDAVRHWESGRRQPEAAARALLIVIAAYPEFVMRSLAKSA